MPTYLIEGKKVKTEAPLSDAEIDEIAASIKGSAPVPQDKPAEAAPASPAASAEAQPVSMMEQMFGTGSPIARTVKGAVIDPLLGINQLLANTGIFGKDIQQGANQLVQSTEQAFTEGRQRVGSTGFDPYQMLGAIVSPANKAVAMTQRGATGLAKLGSAASMGAAQAAVQPVTGPQEDFANTKLMQMTFGAVLGPVAEGTVKAIVSVPGIFQGLTKSGREKALKEHLNSLAGDDKEAVLEALKNAKEIVSGSRPTTAELLADLPSASELIAAQTKLAKQPGAFNKFKARENDQQLARLKELEKLAGTEAERAAIRAERDAITGPMRETALEQSDVAGAKLSKLEQEISDKAASMRSALQETGKAKTIAAQQEVLAREFTPVPGMPRFPGRYSHMAERVPEHEQTAAAFKDVVAQRKAEIKFLEFQKNSLEENGFFPLRADDLIVKLEKAAKGTNNDIARTILQGTAAKLAEKADKNGILSSRDLYENVRKEMNRDILGYLQAAGKPMQGGLQEQEIKVATNVKKMIDAALDKSSDGLWSKYLSTYADYSNKINRMEIGQFLADKLNTPLDRERAGVFAEAVRNAAGTIKTTMGVSRYQNLDQVLTPAETGAVNRVLADLTRKAKATELGKGMANVPEVAEDIVKESPNPLSRTVTLAKAAMEFLQRGNKEAFNNKMTELMLNPEEMVKFLTTTKKPPMTALGKEQELVSAMMKAMNPTTRSAFIQAFAVPSVSNLIGTQQQ